MLSEKFFNTEEVEIEYGEGPDNGPPLVFLVGAPNRYQSYCLNIINTLSKRWHVYAINYRGTGKSGKVPGKYRLIDFTNDTIKFIEHLDEPPVLVGHSFGGMISITVASRMGAKVRAIVLGDPPISNQGVIDWIGNDWFQEFFKMLIGFKDTKPSSKEIAMTLGDGVVTPWSFEKVKTFGYHDKGLYEGIRDTDRLLTDVNLSEDIAKIRCPTLLIQADKVGIGQAIRDNEVEYARSVMHNVIHVLAEGLDHGLSIGTWETSPTLMSQIMQFLEYLRP